MCKESFVIIEQILELNLGKIKACHKATSALRELHCERMLHVVSKIVLSLKQRLWWKWKELIG